MIFYRILEEEDGFPPPERPAPMPDSPKQRLLAEFARIGKAVASPRRLDLLDLLAQGEKPVETLASRSGLGVKNTSAHLRVLREARLVETRRDGTRVFYRLAGDEVFRFLREMQSMARRRLAEVDRLVDEFYRDPDGLEPLGSDELVRRMDAGEVTLLDVRPEDEYRASHLRGARSVPLDELRRRLGELPRDREVVAYCRGPYCMMSVQAVELLRKEGFRARLLEEGARDWQAAGRPVAAGRSVAVACALALAMASGAYAQTAPAENPELEVTDVRPLVGTPPPFPLVESFLVVNPTDPDNLLASAMSVSSDESVVYGSWDGGDTWEQVRGPDGPVFPGGDPMLAFDGNGRAYFSAITPRFDVWRSADGGRTWAGPARIGGEAANDRQWVAAPSTPGEGVHPLHAAAKRVVTLGGREEHVLVTSVSRDGGQTFAEPTFTRPDSGYLHTPTDLVVRRDGTVLLPFLIHYGAAPGGRGRLRGRYFLLVSEDGASTWSPPRRVAETTEYGNRGDLNLMLKGLAAAGLALDETGGAFDGSAYMVWPTVIDDRLQIVALRSRDGGTSWSEPVRVNDGGFESNHSTPSVAVNRDGVVAVTWNDRRHDPADECFHHYVAVSVDGGRTFGEDSRISGTPTCPGSGSRWMNGGETQGLAALPDGNFRVVWSVGSRDDLTPWTAVVRMR